MRNPLKIMSFALLLLSIMLQSSFAYEIPQRRIDLKPYLNFMFPSALLKIEDQQQIVDDKMGIGIGVKARSQVTGNLGFLVNVSLTDIAVNNNSYGSATIFTTGFYYLKETGFGNFILDGEIGVIAAADLAAALIMPALEFNRPITDRLNISAEFGWLILGDWFYDIGMESNSKTFTFSMGSAFMF